MRGGGGEMKDNEMGRARGRERAKCINSICPVQQVRKNKQRK